MGKFQELFYIDNPKKECKLSLNLGRAQKRTEHGDKSWRMKVNPAKRDWSVPAFGGNLKRLDR
jgi:hypothetical protein